VEVGVLVGVFVGVGVCVGVWVGVSVGVSVGVDVGVFVGVLVGVFVGVGVSVGVAVGGGRTSRTNRGSCPTVPSRDVYSIAPVSPSSRFFTSHPKLFVPRRKAATSTVTS
jgi:hypothetical protein